MFEIIEKNNFFEKIIQCPIEIEKLLKRLYFERPLSFCGPMDAYGIVNSNEELKQVFFNDQKFFQVGTKKEDSEINSKNYLTKYERVLSPFLMLLQKVNFRYNGERRSKKEPSFKEGYLIAAVGPRFELKYNNKDERYKFTDYSAMVVHKEQNIEENGYGEKNNNNEDDKFLHLRIQEALYDTKFHTYEEVINLENNKNEEFLEKYVKIKEKFFRKDFYKKRMQYVLQPAFLSANECKIENKEENVYLHLKGIGLGAWAFDTGIQKNLFIEVLEEIFRNNKDKLGKIKFIDFCYFHIEENKQVEIKKKFKDSFDLEVFFSTEGIANAIKNELKLKNTVVGIFAWDGFSFVGNEYFAGDIQSSDDPVYLNSLDYKTFRRIFNPKNKEIRLI